MVNTITNSKLSPAGTASRQHLLQQVTTGYTHLPCITVGVCMAELLMD